MQRSSIGGFLEDFLSHGDDCAYLRRYRLQSIRSSYRQVAENAFRFARELRSRGVARGDRILLWGPNSAEWVAVFFACALAGVVVVPIDDASEPDFALRVWQQVEAKLLLCSRAHQPSALPVLLLEDLGATIAHHASEPLSGEEMGAEDILEIIFTSGTTEEPKGVVITHGNVLANVAPLETEIRKYLKYERWFHPIRFLCLLPLSHVFGQFLGLFLPPLMGATVLFQDALRPGEVARTIRRERVSVLVAVPRNLQSLREKINRDLAERGETAWFQKRFQATEGKNFLYRWWVFRRFHGWLGWKFWAIVSGGATLDAGTEEFWGRLGFAVIQGYGLTETTSLVSVNHPFRRGQGSIGKVLGGREVKLAGDGEILVRGGGVARGYWGRQGLRPVLLEGWYHTGDLGELDAQGQLYFRGRKKDVLVSSSGMNVYPEDLERALQRQPEVKDCAVVGLPQEGNARPCAVLILRDRELSPGPIVERANLLLADYQRMRDWWLWPEEDFPRTATQKPRKNLIQEATVAHFERVPSPANSSASESPAAGSLAALIARLTGRTPAAPSAGAGIETDLNLSSLDRAELLSALEERYQIDLNETQFSALNNLADLSRVLEGAGKDRVRYHYPTWAQRWPSRAIRIFTYHLLLRPAVFLLARPRIEGRANLADLRGPVLLICNHIDDVDIGFVLSALPAHLRNWVATATGGEALEALHTPKGNLLVRMLRRVEWGLGVGLLNLFPLPRAAGFRESFAYAAESVERGYSILVFPEGQHTKDGNMLPFRPGIGLLATNLGLPIVPMRIDGLFEIKQARKKIAPRHAVRIKIGMPLSCPPDRDPEWIASYLRHEVDRL